MNLSDYVELKGIKKGREQGRLEGQREGRLEGHREGLQTGMKTGIRNMIELCQDMGTSEADAQSQIIMRFHIPEDEAIKYIKTFWKAE